MSTHRKRAFEYYLAHQGEMVEEFGGKYVVIKDGEVLGAYDEESTAFTKTEESHELGSFLVQGVSTHYETLGIDVLADTRAIKKAFLEPTVPRFSDEQPFSEEQLRKAYNRLRSPWSRANYDKKLGYTQNQIESAILQTPVGLGWAICWALLWGFLALVLFMGIPENVARMVGSNLAPGYSEEQEWYSYPDCPDCAPTFETRFHSSDSTWEWMLNHGVTTGLIPALVSAIIAFVGYYAMRRVEARVIAWARWRGERDTWVRAALWAVVLPIPVGIFITLFAYQTT